MKILKKIVRKIVMKKLSKTYNKKFMKEEVGTRLFFKFGFVTIFVRILKCI